MTHETITFKQAVLFLDFESILLDGETLCYATHFDDGEDSEYLQINEDLCFSKKDNKTVTLDRHGCLIMNEESGSKYSIQPLQVVSRSEIVKKLDQIELNAQKILTNTKN